MKRKKRTVEERRADQERYDETTRLLIERIDRTGPAPKGQAERREAS